MRQSRRSAEGRSPHPVFDLSTGLVHVVRCPLDVQRAEFDTLERLLSADELERARRYRTERLRQDFIVGRARLRQLLGLGLGDAPDSVRLAISPQGKPRLADAACAWLSFNVGHSGRLMLCALTTHADVGIDVERVREHFEWQDIAARFLSPVETRALTALPPDRQRRAFFSCWTRKEAVVKALGEGLAIPLDAFVVSVDPDEAEMLACDPRLGSVGSWYLVALPVPAGYVAAVALRSPYGAPSVRLHYWHDLASGLVHAS